MLSSLLFADAVLLHYPPRWARRCAEYYGLAQIGDAEERRSVAEAGSYVHTLPPEEGDIFEDEVFHVTGECAPSSPPAARPSRQQEEAPRGGLEF